MSTTKIDPIAEEHRLLSDIKTARVAMEMTRQKASEAGSRRKREGARRLEGEMDEARGVEGATERVEEATRAEQAAAADEERFTRAFEAAGQVIRASEEYIGHLYASEEGFPVFAAR